MGNELAKMAKHSHESDQRIIDAVANAMLDEMDCVNTERMFSVTLPRDKYLPSMRRYALAAITAYVRHSPPPSAAEARERAREIVDGWGGSIEPVATKDYDKSRHGLIDRIAAALPAAQPTLQQAIEKVREMRNEWADELEHPNAFTIADQVERTVWAADKVITALSSLASPSITDQ